VRGVSGARLLCVTTIPRCGRDNKYPIAKILFSIKVSLSHNLYCVDINGINKRYFFQFVELYSSIQKLPDRNEKPGEALRRAQCDRTAFAMRRICNG
jgi:hypothetical protein